MLIAQYRRPTGVWHCQQGKGAMSPNHSPYGWLHLHKGRSMERRRHTLNAALCRLVFRLESCWEAFAQCVMGFGSSIFCCSSEVYSQSMKNTGKTLKLVEKCCCWYSRVGTTASPNDRFWPSLWRAPIVESADGPSFCLEEFSNEPL